MDQLSSYCTKHNYYVIRNILGSYLLLKLNHFEVPLTFREGGKLQAIHGGVGKLINNLFLSAAKL